MQYHFVSEDGWEDFCSSEEEHWELSKLYTMAGTPYTVALIEEEGETIDNQGLSSKTEFSMEGKYDSIVDSHPSLSPQDRNPNLQ